VTTTLDPEREARTPLARLATSAVAHEALERVDAAITHHFPENLFADLDFVAGFLATRPDPLSCADRIVHVHALFGRETPLRFRYAHDFLYGFDWARWVARDPTTRASVGPYDDAFLDYSERRAAELTALVANDDRKYRRLAPGAHRNPFPFRRDPASERTLHRALAASGGIPVPAWSPRAAATWDRPFTALRVEKARALGLAIDAGASD
jgi:hypothetical protein